MLKMRPFNEDKTWGDKQKKDYILDKDGNKIYDKTKRQYKCKSVPTTDWNEKTKAEEWREGWANAVNKYLSEHGVKEKIDHRSYERQGIEQVPTIHLGVAASQMEKRGIRTERGNINREIEITNQQLGQLRARIRKSKDWLYAQPLTNAPTIVDIMSNISAGNNTQTNCQKVRDLKTRANVFMFLQNNNIDDMEQLVDKITQINNDFKDVSDEIKKVDRRLNTLAQHLTQYDNYKNHKAVYDKYKQLEPKKQETFLEKHSDEIEVFKTAQKYLITIMNGKTTIPEKSWKTEQKKLTAYKFSLCEKYYGLQSDVRNMELLRKGTENIMRGETRETQLTRKQELE